MTRSLLVVVLAAAGPRADGPPDVTTLVDQLSHPRFAVREAAHKELLRRGEPIVPELERLASELDRWPTRHSDCARWNVSTTVRNFEAEPISDLITPSLMYLDERHLLSLVSNWAAGTDA